MYTHIIVVIHITHYNKNHLQGLTGRSLMTMIFHYTLSTQKFLKKCFFFPPAPVLGAEPVAYTH